MSAAKDWHDEYHARFPRVTDEISSAARDPVAAAERQRLEAIARQIREDGREIDKAMREIAIQAREIAERASALIMRGQQLRGNSLIALATTTDPETPR